MQLHLMVVSIRQSSEWICLTHSLCRRKSGGMGVGGWGWVWCWGWGWTVLERVIFFSSGVKGGRSCVQSSWQKALLCAAYADRGGSFVHRWRSHAWVCLRRRGKGGRRGEKSVGEEEGVEGGVSLALSAITVSGGGRGQTKPSWSCQVHTLGRRGHKAHSEDTKTSNPIVESQRATSTA